LHHRYFCPDVHPRTDLDTHEPKRIMEEHASASRQSERPVAASIEKLLGGWQFIWYDYEDHAPKSLPSDTYVNALPPAYISHTIRTHAKAPASLDTASPGVSSKP
jgi:hypothetical protein